MDPLRQLALRASAPHAGWAGLVTPIYERSSGYSVRSVARPPRIIVFVSEPFRPAHPRTSREAQNTILKQGYGAAESSPGAPDSLDCFTYTNAARSRSATSVSGAPSSRAMTDHPDCTVTERPGVSAAACG